MSVTVQSIVNAVGVDLLEPNPPGFLTGNFTQQEILDILGPVLMDFLKQTGLIWNVFTQFIQAGVPQYPVPDSMMEVVYVFVDAKIIEPVDLFSNYLLGQWTRKPDYPKAWHQDGLPIKTVEIVPAANWNGVPPNPSPPQPPFGFYGSFQPGDRDLTFVGPVLASKEVWSIGDTLDGIPDSFTPYLVFGILEKLFLMDGELKDMSRANYCRTRYREGIKLAKIILMRLMGDEE